MKLKRVFAAYDLGKALYHLLLSITNSQVKYLDGDGSISPDEFRTVWKSLGFKISEYQLYKLMNTIDLDKNGSISFVEFLRGYPHLEELTGVFEFTEVVQDLISFFQIVYY